MSQPEQEHIVGAFSFELGKCQSEEVKDRVLANLANVDAGLTSAVAANLGKAAPKGKPARGVVGSPALSLMPSAPAPVAGRVVGILASDGVDGAGLLSLVKAISAAGAVAQVIAPHGGSISGQERNGGRGQERDDDAIGRIRRARGRRGHQGPQRSVPTPTPHSIWVRRFATTSRLPRGAKGGTSLRPVPSRATPRAW